VATAVAEGIGPATALLPLLLVMIAAFLVNVSLVLARAGVARPDLDVVQFIVRRPKAEYDLPPISMGASVLQLLMSIVTIPAAKALDPSILYQPEIGPSGPLLMWTALVTLLTAVGAAAAWWGRIEWQAPREQQREAQKYA
jgi:hypothetical protein